MDDAIYTALLPDAIGNSAKVFVIRSVVDRSEKRELYHRSDYERDVGVVRDQLDDATWQPAWAEGRVMTLEEAIAYALNETADPMTPERTEATGA